MADLGSIADLRVVQVEEAGTVKELVVATAKETMGVTAKETVGVMAKETVGVTDKEILGVTAKGVLGVTAKEVVEATAKEVEDMEVTVVIRTKDIRFSFKPTLIIDLIIASLLRVYVMIPGNKIVSNL